MAPTSFAFNFRNGVYLVFAKEHLPNVYRVNQGREYIVFAQLTANTSCHDVRSDAEFSGKRLDVGLSK